MKEVKLIERKPSERLIGLVDAIPEFEILNNRVICRDSHRTSHAIYSITEGCINMRYNKDLVHYNPLRNSKKLLIANDSFSHITEESFCDLLEEHLYLVAKEKMEALLPQIQEHYPDAILEDDQILIMLDSENPEWVAEIQGTQAVAGWGGSYGQHDIWEDADMLIVKKPKPWWSGEHYIIKFDPWSGYATAHKDSDMDTRCKGTIGKTKFETFKEAQTMCDKLNAVLRGK